MKIGRASLATRKGSIVPVSGTLLLTEDQPLIMMSRDAGAIHCDFAYNFNAAMISNSIRTVHSVPSDGRRRRRAATRKGSILPKRQHIYSRYSSTLGSYCSIYFWYTSSLGSYCSIYSR